MRAAPITSAHLYVYADDAAWQAGGPEHGLRFPVGWHIKVALDGL